MKRHDKPSVSIEQLNAYLDDELAFEERNRVFVEMGQDEELNREAQELRQLRAMLQHAYRTPPPPPQSGRKEGGRSALNALAAGLLLAVGAIGGWYGNGELNSVHPSQGAQHVMAAQENLLLHLSSDEPARMAATLDYAEQQLAENRRQGKAFRLEVVANDGGIELLRRDTSPYARRIAKLLAEYDNVSFLACANALRNMRERGIEVELLPGTRSDHTAIDTIIERLEGGWRYLKV
jgi:intracellular sulfur oxidation DsrE/DsrF family protein